MEGNTITYFDPFGLFTIRGYLAHYLPLRELISAMHKRYLNS